MRPTRLLHARPVEGFCIFLSCLSEDLQVMDKSRKNGEKQALNPLVKKIGLLIFLGIPLLIVLFYFFVLILGMLGIIEPEGL